MLVERNANHALRRSRLGVTALFVAAALLFVGAVGCGDDESQGSGAASNKGYVKEARALIHATREAPEFKSPGPAIDVSSLRGKRILLVAADNRVPILVDANKAATEAGQAVGLQMETFDAKAEVGRMVEGIERGIRGADAVVLTGVPIDAVQQPLRAAKEAGVPTVSILNNQPDEGVPGQGAGPLMYASANPDYFKAGELVAAKAIMDTDGAAKVEIFTADEIAPARPVAAGMTKMLGACTDCDVSSNSTPLAEWTTALAGKAQSVIRANPNLNYILPTFSAQGIFITSGIRQAAAGEKVKLATVDGTPAALKLVQDGDINTANVGWSTPWLAWQAIDQAMRGMLGKQPANPVIPLRFLDKSNLQGVDVQDLNGPYDNPDYESGFRKLWGLE